MIIFLLISCLSGSVPVIIIIFLMLTATVENIKRPCNFIKHVPIVCEVLLLNSEIVTATEYDVKNTENDFQKLFYVNVRKQCTF